MAVSNMVVDKPLIATGKEPQLFQVSASADWKSRNVTIRFYSVTADGKKTTDHAYCVLEYAKKDDWLKEWIRNTYLVRSRIDALKLSVDGGQSHKIKSGMAYKLFAALVDYGQSYQGMREIVLDSARLEATARVEFQTTEKDGEYHLSPYWIDSLGHLAGFVMNASDGTDSKNTVFVNHGWESMRCATRFSQGKTYQTYVRMQNVGGTMFAGDVYIFDEDTVVAMYQGVKVSLVWLFECICMLTQKSSKVFPVGPLIICCRQDVLLHQHRSQRWRHPLVPVQRNLVSKQTKQHHSKPFLKRYRPCQAEPILQAELSR